MTEDILEEEGLGLKQKQKSIVDHLQAPRRKKKNYVTVALGQDVDIGLKQRIEYYVKLNFPSLTVVYIKDLKELAKMYSRQIVLLLISDDFAKLDAKIEIIKRFKEKNRKTGMPVLFFTKKASALTDAYHEKLLAYQEIDDYIDHDTVTNQHIIELVGSILTKKHNRRSRRFPVPVAVSYKDLRTDKSFAGVLHDISMHGALIQKEKSAPLFKEGDQLSLKIQLPKSINETTGETIRLSAKVRRALIGGEKSGISWEFMSEEKTTALLGFITGLSNARLEKLNWAAKAEAAYKRKNRG